VTPAISVGSGQQSAASGARGNFVVESRRDTQSGQATNGRGSSRLSTMNPPSPPPPLPRSKWMRATTSAEAQQDVQSNDRCGSGCSRIMAPIRWTNRWEDDSAWDTCRSQREKAGGKRDSRTGERMEERLAYPDPPSSPRVDPSPSCERFDSPASTPARRWQQQPRSSTRQRHSAPCNHSTHAEWKRNRARRKRCCSSCHKCVIGQIPRPSVRRPSCAWVSPPRPLGVRSHVPTKTDLGRVPRASADAFASQSTHVLRS
jgi:hypothetical protein